MTEKQRIQKLEAAAKLIEQAAALVDETVPGSRWEENGAEACYRDMLRDIVIAATADAECLPKHIALLKNRREQPTLRREFC